jgi:hypothetical protein
MPSHRHCMNIRLFLTLLGCATVGLAQPSVVSLTPLNGSGPTATFTSVYRHAGGVNQSYLGYLLILPTPNIVQYTATGSCLIEYNRISNGMRLIDNAGTGWLGPIEGYKVGPAGTVLTNAYCTVNTRDVTVAFTTTDMIITVPVTFFGNFTGPLGTFLQLWDVNDVKTGMTQFGNWTAYPLASPKPGPYVGQVTIPPYTKAPVNVDVFTGHTSGLANIFTSNVLVADKIVGGNIRCHIIYFQATHDIRLVNAAGDGFVTNTPQQNGQCAIGNFNDLLYASGSGNEVHLHIPMQWNPSLPIPQKLNVWINTFDNFGKLTHWIGAQ